MIVPPATLGILGGGQLGRYFVVAARTMGYRTMVLEPDRGSPAGAVADEHVAAAYDDLAALDHLAAECAVVTTEFENPPAAALSRLAAQVPVHPSPHAIGIAQDRRTEKRFLTAAGIPVAPFEVIDAVEELRVVARRATFPAILKTARLGYDGKGQVGVDSADELGAAWDDLGGVPCVLEQRVELEGEVSVIIARSSAGGATLAYPLCANIHRNGILDVTVAPGPYVPEAYAFAERIVTALDYVGVLAVELFVTRRGVLVNELAPRPHNSGHWTLDHSVTSQFEQQVRAVCGLPLADPSLTVESTAMVNVLGDAWVDGEPDWAAVLGHPAAPKLHLYGKASARPGRKMGHLTIAAPSPPEALALAPGDLAVSGTLTMLASIGEWLSELGHWLTTAAEHIDDAAGNWWFLAVVGGIAFSDSIFPVAPSETVVIIAGVAVATDTAPYPLWLLILVAAAGAFLGDNVSYGIGHLFGGRLQRRADRKPTFARKLQVARDQIHKRGGLLLITARFLPGGRTLVTMTCGVTHQPYRWFVKWDLLAVLIWASYGAGLAYVVGQPLEKHRGLAFLAAFGAAVIINVTIEVVRRVRKSATDDAAGRSDAVPADR